jgi:TetR/AcrR family transcriptional repressor of nem operon
MARRKEFDPDKALERAMLLFWLRGYKETSVRDLCDHMGIKKGSLYDTFGSKRSLYLAALNRYQKMYKPPSDLVQKSGSAKSAIAAIFNQNADFSVNDKDCRGCFVVNTIVELASNDEEFALIGFTVRHEYEEMFHRLLIAAQEMGEITPNRDLIALARFLTNAMFGLRVTAKTTRDRVILEDIVNSTLFVLN